MNRWVVLILLLLHAANLFAQKRYEYPEAEKENNTEVVFGKIVRDPYRWMEDITSPKVETWLKQQEKVKIKNTPRRFQAVFTINGYSYYIDFDPIFKKGKYYFMYIYTQNNRTPSLYYGTKADEVRTLLFDPNWMEKNITKKLVDFEVSPNNKYVALIIANFSSDWKVVQFMDIEKKEMLSDTLNFIINDDVCWNKRGVFYSRFNVQSTTESMKGIIGGEALYYHYLGTSQDQDRLIYKPINDSDIVDFKVTPDKNYLILETNNRVNGKKITTLSTLKLPFDSTINFKEFIVSGKDQVYYNVIGELSNKLLVETNLNAPKGAVYLYDVDNLNSGELFIPEYKESLQNVLFAGDKLLKIYSNDSQYVCTICDSTGQELNYFKILPGYKIDHISAAKGDSIVTFFMYSFYDPPSIIKLNVNTFERKAVSKTEINFENDNLTTEKVYYYTKDSTRIPMYLTHRRDMVLNGHNPVLLYGYGGFGISTTPFFKLSNILFMNNGGILAAPCLRGGGDFPGWHEQGMGLKKQNTFDDFIAAAEYLINNHYTNKQRIAAMGGSNGGLVVAACMVQRPELFKAAIMESGVFDMLRYDKYGLGYLNKREYGDLSDSMQFLNIYNYSPVNNISKGVNYPATLLVADDHDDRVLPFHSFKFLAELQEKGGKQNPYILYYEKRGGHSGSDILSFRKEKEAYIYSFIYEQLDMQDDLKFYNFKSKDVSK